MGDAYGDGMTRGEKVTGLGEIVSFVLFLPVVLNIDIATHGKKPANHTVLGM